MSFLDHGKEPKTSKAQTHSSIPKLGSQIRKVEQRKKLSLAYKTKSIGLTTKTKRSVPRSGPSLQQPALTTRSDAAESSELQNILSLLSLLHHRNKNQHRTQRWWKYFSMLRRTIRDLVAIETSISSLAVEGAASLRQGLKAEDVRRRLARERELEETKGEMDEWVREVLLGRCYLAFSGVVADKQFAVLGVALMGVLAQIGGVTGLPKVQAKMITSVSEVRTGKMMGEVVERMFDTGGEETDLGQVIDRDAVDRHIEVNAQKSTEDATSTDKADDSAREERARQDHGPESGTKRTGKKKKRKKTNAIDDLFGDLL